MVCAGTMGTDILTAPVLPTIGLAVEDKASQVATEKLQCERTATNWIHKLTCLYGAGAGTTGLCCAARCRCCDQADIVEPASWNLNLLHIRLRQRNDGLELRATNSPHSHRLHRFNILKITR